jgi:hypothetical protein
MKQEEKTILFDQNRYYVRNLDEILSIFQQIVE